MTLADRLQYAGRLRRRRRTASGRLPGRRLLPLPPPLALLSPRLFSLLARSIPHLRAPPAPSPIRRRAGRTTVPLKRVVSGEPAATAFQKARPPAAPTRGDTTRPLTTGRFGTRLRWAHGRFSLPVGSSPGAGAVTPLRGGSSWTDAPPTMTTRSPCLYPRNFRPPLNSLDHFSQAHPWRFSRASKWSPLDQSTTWSVSAPEMLPMPEAAVLSCTMNAV
jgi:hypothetical protein